MAVDLNDSKGKAFAKKKSQIWTRVASFFMVMGPGLIVMQADTEAGSITTA